MASHTYLLAAALVYGFSVGGAEAQDPSAKPTITIDSPTEGGTEAMIVNIKFHVTGMKIGLPVAEPENTPIKTGHIHVNVDGNSWV